MSEEQTLSPDRLRARAVFSQEDFELIKVAIVSYLREVNNTAEAVKYSNLYHRLGRIT